MNRSYSVSELNRLVADATANGYQIVQLSPPAFGLGHLLLIAPRPGFYSFEITEESFDRWRSQHTVLRRFTKISNRIQSMIDSAKKPC